MKTDARQTFPADMSVSGSIFYSECYSDDTYEYRHVILPMSMARSIPQIRTRTLMTEEEWRAHGIMQSRGWVHYVYHLPEPHILLFRRPKHPVTNRNENAPS